MEQRKKPIAPPAQLAIDPQQLDHHNQYQLVLKPYTTKTNKVYFGDIRLSLRMDRLRDDTMNGPIAELSITFNDNPYLLKSVIWRNKKEPADEMIFNSKITI